MPRCAAPKATKVATSKERTRMMSRSAWLVVKRSCRASGSAKAASGSMPARANSGAASLRMRPLGSARISFSLASLDTTICSSNKCPPLVESTAGLFDRMGGLPRGGPRLPDIPQMACKPAYFQPDGPACGEPQRDRLGAFLHQRQHFEHAVGLVQGDIMVADGRHLVENKGGMGPRMGRLDRRIGLPAEPVQKQNEALLVLEVGAVAHRHQSVRSEEHTS